MSEMQAAGKNEMSAMDNLIIMNPIRQHKNQRAQKLNTYMFFTDAVKCFNKIWLIKELSIRNVYITQAMIQTL